LFNEIMKKKDCRKAWRSVRRTIKGKRYKVEGITTCEKCQKLHNCKSWEGIAIREGQNVIKIYHI
jgi:hypothetical protein